MASRLCRFLFNTHFLITSVALAVGMLVFSISAPSVAQPPVPEIPEALKPWEAWAKWGTEPSASPKVWNDSTKRIKFWPSRLSLEATPTEARWSVSMQLFETAWVPLPGDASLWPQEVTANEQPVVVVERDGRPMTKLPAGEHLLQGTLPWDTMPQSIPLPNKIGLLKLTVDGDEITFPKWDRSGHVWLRRRSEAAEKNLLTAEVFRVLEDGIPMWLRTEVHLKVSGKSREEELGWALPAGWRLATVDSQLPVAVDDQGRVKAQVRAGKWTIRLHAFRTDDQRTIEYADEAQPITDNELFGFQARDGLRVVEVTGARPVDVNQTTWPAAWRHLPVWQWETSSAITLDEKMRGMGQQRTPGLAISRTLWLDEDGAALTWSDTLVGQRQERWRLDVKADQELGAAKINGTGQLITTNPTTGDRGVEVRARNVRVEAVGRCEVAPELSATGWQTDADQLQMQWNLPPGWRMLACFGVDDVRGDWLTAWSLWDLFLLLIFSMAALRIWGVWAGLLAFLAFGLAYHEPGAPRLTWLFLLAPVALYRVVPDGKAKFAMAIWKYAALALLVLHLTPFVTSQIQTALFPQLEWTGVPYENRRVFSMPASRGSYQSVQLGDTMAPPFANKDPFAGEASPNAGFEQEELDSDANIQMGKSSESSWAGKRRQKIARFSTKNMLQSAKAKIQTGPAQPVWNWNQVTCRWDGPVAADQQVRPIFLSATQHRLLNVARIALLLLLVAVFAGAASWKRKWLPKSHPAVTAAMLAMLLSFGTGVAEAQEFPSSDLLKDLRARLTLPEQAVPRGAEIAGATLEIVGNRATMKLQVHAAARVAVPLPGRIPAWSPVSVDIDGAPAEALCRRDCYLWTVIPAGVHEVTVVSQIPDVADWEWTWLLKPRFVTVTANGWNVTGLGADGVPEQQIFFARQQQATAGRAAYDQKNFNSVVVIDRYIETGLTWQVRSTVTRLSQTGKAVAIRVPLLAGESVLSSEVNAKDGQLQVRLAADESTFSWTSDLPIGKDIELTAPVTDLWVERWHLATSPVWNVAIDGLPPIFEAAAEDLVPVWHPWPSEQVTLSFSQPKAITGETMTVQKVEQATSLGSRQRTTELKLAVQCSLGGDFAIDIDPEAQIESVTVGQRDIPVRRENGQLIVPVRPGRQEVKINWRTQQALAFEARPDAVRLPYEGANVSTAISVPESRWVLWTDGPTRGPAVQFWVILIFSLLAALFLGGFSLSPLSRLEWGLLVIGLTQVPLPAALIVVAWLFVLAWRGREQFLDAHEGLFNCVQVLIVLLTVTSIGVLVAVVGEGLLGQPEMFIRGNGSSQFNLRWFQARTADTLPLPRVFSCSVWVYRFLMLCWALWLASALLRWLITGWQRFSSGGYWKQSQKPDDIIDATSM